jgi:peptide/nickel transport system permease protein
MTPQTKAAFRRCLASPRVLLGAFLILALILVAVFARFLAPHDPTEQDLLYTLLPPAWATGGEPAYPLGTDSLGRCILSRLIYGSRVALFVAVVSATGAMVLGTSLALLAGYFGRRTDWLIARAVDIWMAFPPVVLALILLVGLGAGVNKVILAIIIIDWTRFCRVIRSEVLVVMKRDYIPAARLVGFSHVQVILKEVLPAVTPLLLTLLSLEMGIAVIIEATMSFVGLSVEADVPAWGVMIADARQFMHQAPWGVVMPMLAIFTTVLAFNLLGDGLRRALDPRLLIKRQVTA